MRKSSSKIPYIRTELPGPKTREVLEEDKRYVWPTLSPHPPIVWDEGIGAIVKDIDGNVFIDFTSGVVCTNTGHCHPEVVKAIKNQVEKLIHCYDFAHSVRYKAFKALSEVLPSELKKILLLSTGTEATEASIKVARAYTKKIEIISFYGAFHGRTYLATTLGSWKVPDYAPYDHSVIQVPYAYCYRCPFDKTYPECDLYCIHAIEEAIKYQSSGNIAALIIEPYQGSAGNIVPPREFLQSLKKLCDEHEVIFIADEIQSGFGRTGKFFAIEHFSIVPDILLAGKGIASGVPTSMVATRSELVEKLKPGSMSSTFGGNPLSCAAIVATVKVMREEKLPENAERMGRYAAKRLEEMLSRYKYLGDVRVLGLAIALEFVEDKRSKKPAPGIAEKIVYSAFKRGLLLLNPIGVYRNCIRLAPPLTIDKEIMDKGLDILEEAIREVCLTS